MTIWVQKIIIVLKNNTIIVQLDIIGLKLIYIADEWACWLISRESKSRRNRDKQWQWPNAVLN